MTAESNEESKLRFRRTQSAARAEEITKNENQKRMNQPDKP
jgi:hypothetical protein